LTFFNSMDENELKNRLQHDAELFSKVFDEELCRRIKNEISGQRNLLYARKNHQFVLQYAVLICSSILIGIGIWSLTRPHSQTDPNAITQTENVYPSDSRMNIMPSQVSLSPEPAPVQNPPQAQPSVFDIPNGTLFDLSVPKPQSLEELSLVLIPGHGLVRLNHRPESQAGEKSRAEGESRSNFLDEATEIVRVPMGWILEEE
ncbi:hypothetical protein IKP13_05035, partial [bacterium]|nr:hypothetical protein [bacterium]